MKLILTPSSLIAPLVQRPLKRDRDIVLKHATPIIEERKKIIEEAEQKGVEPNLPVRCFSFLSQDFYQKHLELTGVYRMISSVLQ